MIDTLILTIVLGALAGGAGFRLRGADLGARLLGGSGILARLVWWAAPMGIVAAVAGDPWWVGPAIGAAAFGAASIGTVDAIDAGRVDGTRAKDAFWNLLRGLGMGGLLALPLTAAGDTGWWMPLAAGALLPGAYEAAWRIFRNHPTAWAEVAVGALLGASVAA